MPMRGKTNGSIFYSLVELGTMHDSCYCFCNKSVRCGMFARRNTVVAT